MFEPIDRKAAIIAAEQLQMLEDALAIVRREFLLLARDDVPIFCVPSIIERKVAWSCVISFMAASPYRPPVYDIRCSLQPVDANIGRASCRERGCQYV